MVIISYTIVILVVSWKNKHPIIIIITTPCVQTVPQYEDYEREVAAQQSRLLPPDSLLLLNLGHNRELVSESAAAAAAITNTTAALPKRDGRTGPIPVHRYLSSAPPSFNKGRYRT